MQKHQTPFQFCSASDRRRGDAAFNEAVDEVTAAARRLMGSLVTAAPAKSREEFAAKARERASERYARP